MRAEILTQLIEAESMSALQGVAKQSLTCSWDIWDAGGPFCKMCKMPRLKAAADLVLLGTHRGVDCMLWDGRGGTGQVQHHDIAVLRTRP